MTAPHIVWLRRDLRMADQPALYAAAQAGPVIPVYVLDDDRAGDHAYGGASKVWLHHSLETLGKSYGAHNSSHGGRKPRTNCAMRLPVRGARSAGCASTTAITCFRPAA